MRFLLIILIIFSYSSIYSELIEMSNEYVVVTVDDNTSGFYFLTTGGDPDLASDDNRNLLFKKNPPTSTTFFEIDGDLTFFGSFDGYYISRAKFKDGRIVAEWSYKGLEIMQIIELIKGPSTGRRDNIRISYMVRNVSSSKKRVKAEIILDTYLGDRDGIRFALDNAKIVSNEIELRDDDVPEYCYAFSSIEDPVARIQATFKHEKILINPSRVIFARWRRIFDQVFDFVPNNRPFPEGNLFDSGIGIIFPEQVVEPGNSVLFSTIFGIYGVNVYKNDLFAMSISSSKVVSAKPFTISVNVMNKTAINITNGKIKLVLPDELKMTENSSAPIEYYVSNFASSNVITISYQLKSTKDIKAFKNSSVNVFVEANVNGSNVTLQGERKFIIISSNSNVNWLNLTEEENNVFSKFPFGSAELTPEIKKVLDKTVDTFKELPNGARVLVTGFTDNVGDYSRNLILGKQRAEAVVKYLRDFYGLNHIMFITESKAFENPIADNVTEEGRQKNRRVEITLLED